MSPDDCSVAVVFNSFDHSDVKELYKGFISSGDVCDNFPGSEVKPVTILIKR